VRLLLVQHTASPDPAANRPSVQAALDAALAAQPVRPDLVVLPEATQAEFGPVDRDLTTVAEPLDGPFVQMVGATAQRWGIPVVAGMFEAREGHLPWNTLVVLGPAGTVTARYRKAHLYDAFGYRESARLSPGPVAPAVIDVPGGGSGADSTRVGLMTCYDLRFPEQARALVDAGAALLVVPAAWLRGPSKEAHWQVLLRARAIESTVYVAGVGQSGDRYCGLTSLIDPMGTVVAGLGEQDGWVAAEVLPERVQQVRSINPSLANRRWTVRPA
jgi:deaminated glutathione amidase